MTGDNDDKPRPVMSAAFWAMLGLAAMSVAGSLFFYLAFHG